LIGDRGTGSRELSTMSTGSSSGRCRPRSWPWSSTC